MTTTDYTPLTPRRLRRCEVTMLAALYWPLEEIDNAVNICLLESNYHTDAWNTINEDSRGLWQINVKAHPDLEKYNLFDPQVNAYWAHKIWQDANNWNPWRNAARDLGLI